MHNCEKGLNVNFHAWHVWDFLFLAVGHTHHIKGYFIGQIISKEFLESLDKILNWRKNHSLGIYGFKFFHYFIFLFIECHLETEIR